VLQVEDSCQIQADGLRIHRITARLALRALMTENIE
jgi:hypothetical protein